MAKPSPVKIPTTTLDDYSHSPFHYAVVLGDHSGLLRLVSSLPKLTEPEQIHTESDSIRQERVSEIISAVIDRRDVPFQETPLHLAVRIGDVLAVKTISSAGADATLRNVSGWNALHEAVSRGNAEITEMVLRHQRRSGWCKWRRRLPYLVSVLGRMRDFYAEVTINFESSVIPLFRKVAPSDTYRIWKRGGDLRVDTLLTGFDRFKIRKANQRFLFLSDEDESPGKLLVLNRDDKTISNAFENAGDAVMDVTKAELVVMKNWRGKEKVESVGEWEAKGYEVKNVSFSSKTEKNSVSDSKNGRIFSRPLLRQLSCSDAEEKEVQRPSSRRRRQSVSLPVGEVPVVASVPVMKEKETVKSLSPLVWLTNDFPLKTEELLPVLDILAINVEAVRRMREMLTVKFPAGSFPVKLSIPVIPTVKAVITFSKFVTLPPMDQFYTPLSSPRHISAGVQDQCNVESDVRTTSTSRPSFTKPSWLRLMATKKSSQRRLKKEQAQKVDLFAIPAGYKWTSKSV